MIYSFKMRLYNIMAAALCVSAALTYGSETQAQTRTSVNTSDSHQSLANQDVIPEGIILQPSPTIGPNTAIAASPDQEFCITVMSGFPDKGAGPRYQFYKLVQELAKDATPEFQRAMLAYGDAPIDPGTPIMNVIENIANPVLRQAAPEFTISNMAHLIDFNMRCGDSIANQISSLIAFDETVTQSDTVIAEDALYLRQILRDSLISQGATENPEFAYSVQAYDAALVSTRNNIEFDSFTDDISNLESLYMDDLDGRLARSNEIINSEIDGTVLTSAVELSDDLIEAADEARKRGMLETLIYILR